MSNEAIEDEPRIVGPDGEVPQVLQVGQPCPFCGKNRVEPCFGGGARCYGCGTQQIESVNQ